MAKKKTKLDKMSKKEKTSLAYALATNLAKHGKPQTPKNERKLTKGEMKKKEKHMGKFKKAFDLEEQEFSKKYDDNPAIKGKQSELPDALQKAIIKKADGKVDEGVLMSLAQQIMKDRDLKPKSKVKTNQEELPKNYNFMTGKFTEDLDIGHQDNEPHMLKKDLYRIAKYAAELYKMIDQFDVEGQEVDFPQWWQAKIITSKEAMVKAKHYLDGELQVNKIDNMFDALDESHSGNPNDKYVVRPCKNKKEPWAVWEGEVRVKGFASKEEAQKFADKKNKEQGLSEEDKEYKVLSTKELNRLAALPPTHPSHKKDRRYKRLTKKK